MASNTEEDVVELELDVEMDQEFDAEMEELINMDLEPDTSSMEVDQEGSTQSSNTAEYHSDYEDNLPLCDLRERCSQMYLSDNEYSDEDDQPLITFAGGRRDPNYYPSHDDISSDESDSDQGARQEAGADLQPDDDVEAARHPAARRGRVRNNREAEANPNEYHPVWHGTPYSAIDTPVFVNPTGAILPANFDPNTAAPADYFGLLFTQQMYEMIVKHTNMYADFKIAWQETLTNTTDKQWTPLSVAELKAYFGILILLGLHPTKNLEHVWSNDPFLCNAGIKMVMPFNRYKKISQYLHITDPFITSVFPRDTRDKLSKVEKVKPIIDLCLHKFQSVYRNTEHQTIDEAMIKFKGRVSYIQYMPMKPIRRGIKLFCRNSGENGYLYDAQVYLGATSDKDKETQAQQRERGTSKKGAYYDIVMSLCEPLEGYAHTLYMDNLYTSVPLLRDLLLKKRIYSCGTLRQNKKFTPEEMKGNFKTLKRGASQTWQDRNCPNLTCTVWMDTKLVRFISTCSNPRTIAVGQRRIGGEPTNVTMPIVAKQYGKYMGGTDKHDRLRLSYNIGRKSPKAWKYIFFFYFNSALVNSWIIYKEVSRRTSKKSFAHIDYRQELAIGLIDGFSCRKRSSKITPYRKQPVHGTEGRKHENVKFTMKGTRRCKGHPKYKPDGKDKRQTVYGCFQCNIPLCKLCHFMWHK